MTDGDVQVRLNQVSKQRWSVDLVKEVYGVDLSEKSSLVVQFKLWAGRYDKDLTVIGDDVDRWMFQLFLQDREWVPSTIAAPQLGLKKDDFENVLGKMKEKSFISEVEHGGLFPSVYSKNFINDLPERLPSFPRQIWASRSSHVRAFHTALEKDLGFEVSLLLCSASIRFGDPDPEVSIEQDIITNEPIGLKYQDWMNFGQPIALKPDACSIFTLAQHAEVLAHYRMSKGKDELLERASEVIGQGK